jgi:hypothetical protein
MAYFSEIRDLGISFNAWMFRAAPRFSIDAQSLKVVRRLHILEGL